jgi:branched-subunit amino acid ABC-type transport system permease component
MLLIASLGVYIIINNIILIFWGAQTIIIRSSEVEVGNQFFSAYITDIQLVIFICVFLLIFITRIFINKSNLGKQIKAVSSNPELANIFGISSNKIILLAFAIGSSLAAVTGVLVAFDTDLTPSMGFNLLLYGIVAMIIGGIGNFYGLMGGSFLLATTQHLGMYYFDGKWMDAVAFIILILFLLWKPLGISGNKLKKTQI